MRFSRHSYLIPPLLLSSLIVDDKNHENESRKSGGGVLWGILISLWTAFIYALFLIKFIDNYLHWSGGR